jgi:hypothetical protein
MDGKPLADSDKAQIFSKWDSVQRQAREFSGIKISQFEPTGGFVVV